MASSSLCPSRGITLIESCCALAIAAILVALGAPDLGRLLVERRLESAVHTLVADLRAARVLAAARGEPVRWTLRTAADGTCYMVHEARSGACHCESGETSDCEDGSPPLRTVHLPASRGVTLQGNVSAIVFDPRLGTASPGATLHLVGSHGRALDCVVNILGRVRVCSPEAMAPGHRRC
ncbi:MAG: GspH/FimT family pseudopilin [Pseudomonadota bacterium]|nr:GspH/FimT family pseudopilin [Pseudomonadota bacterium]